MANTIDKLIINSPYKEPEKHWYYDRENRSFTLDEVSELSTLRR